MSFSATFVKSIGLAGKTFSESTTIVSDAVIGREEVVPAAKSGVLTTRVSDTAGTITMDSATHTVTTGARIDIYFSGGVTLAATVGTVAGTAVPFTLGTGDVLPSASTVVAVSLPEKTVLDVIGDNIKSIVMFPTKRGAFLFTGSDEVADFTRVLGDGIAAHYYDGDGTTNPVPGDTLAFVFMSHGDTTGGQVMRYAVGYN